MAVTADPIEEAPAPTAHRRRGIGLVVWLNLAVLFVYQGSIHLWIQVPAARNWSTVFMATVLQALPFLLLGVTVGAIIAAFIPAVALARALPKRALLAVPVAGHVRRGAAGLRVQRGADREPAGDRAASIPPPR